MVYTIENQYLKVQISRLGGELKSLTSKMTGLNHIWCGDNAVWGKTSPNLFPHIGVPKGGGYTICDEWFPMARHGFLRDSEMKLVQKTSDSLLLEFAGNDKTAAMLPNKFSIIVGYSLKDKSLKTSFTVINNDSKIMYFALGGHTAFSTENNLNSLSDYVMKFDKTFDMTARRINSAGFLNDDTEDFGHSDILHLDTTLFDRDVIIFKDIPSKSVALQSDSTALQLDFDGFAHLGIWTKGDCNRYVCIEPWTTLPDRYDYDNSIETKESIQSLTAGDSRDYAYTITIKE